MNLNTPNGSKLIVIPKGIFIQFWRLPIQSHLLRQRLDHLEQKKLNMLNGRPAKCSHK